MSRFRMMPKVRWIAHHDANSVLFVATKPAAEESSVDARHWRNLLEDKEEESPACGTIAAAVLER